MPTRIQVLNLTTLWAALALLAGCMPQEESPLQPPLHPSRWPSIAGVWRFIAQSSAPVEIPQLEAAICQNGPELNSDLILEVEEGTVTSYLKINGILRLDGTLAVKVVLKSSEGRSVWAIWGGPQEFKGYYKPSDKELFFPVEFQGRRIGPVPHDVNCPPGFRRA